MVTIMRKRICVLALAGVMAAAFAGCGSSASGTTAGENAQSELASEMVISKVKATTPTGEPEVVTPDTGVEIAGGEGEMISGGWQDASSMKITDEHKELFKKAQETLTGATYTPIAFLGSQVVAGTNYRFLCRMDASVSELNAKPVYSVVVIYQDLQGNATISEIHDSEVEAPASDQMMVGAYEQAEDLSMTSEATKAFDLATKTLTGAEYKAVALLGSQVVAGTNYRILCETKASTNGSETGWAIVTVYADLNGKAEITDIAEIK